MEKSLSQIKIQSDVSELLDIKNGLSQGDALSCLLFNVVLDKVISGANILTRGMIFYRTTQILGFADDIDGPKN